MNVTAQKLDIIHWVTELTDHATLGLLGGIKERSTHRQDWWNMLSVEEQASIEQGLTDAVNGKLTPHSEVKKRYERWLDNSVEVLPRLTSCQ
jgi:predicted transcriptional regulator